MRTMLERGEMLIAQATRSPCTVLELLGEGGQAEVFRTRIADREYAVKWYRPEYLRTDRLLWERLRNAISIGLPCETFLWPFDLVAKPGASQPGGYLMPVKPGHFVSLVQLITRRCEPSFRALSTLGFHLAHSFLRLHAAGLCYRDINFGNVFFDPESGAAAIGDTDNVDIDRRPGGVLGTWGFMAPEVALRKAEPSSMSDRFSLAVLLFYIFMMGHPLKGKAEMGLPHDPDDPDASKRLCAMRPVFVFDPDDESNRPVAGVHDAVANFWPIYPQSLRDRFTAAFTIGLRDPEARVMDNDWRKEMVRLRDCIFPCSECGAELFFDLGRLRKTRSLGPCWSCSAVPQPPPRMRLGQSAGEQLVMLNPGVELFAHHLGDRSYDFLEAWAQVVSRPLGLKNLSPLKWQAIPQEGAPVEVPPGSTLELIGSLRIDFGKVQAAVRASRGSEGSK